ncbi:MAG: HAMP domain-containing histidine kinase [Acidobacteria bacterium]|nr:HAMP domain-containing histidine kinase [Acidobacteriota bacterium]
MSAPSSAFDVDFGHNEPAASPNSADVLAKLTHELAQPLETIQSIAYYLRMVSPKDDQRTQDHLKRIEEVVLSMNGTLNDAVHYLREAPSNPQVVDLHELVTEALAERAASRPPEFRVHFAPGLALIRADVGQARHLIRSLVNTFHRMAGRCHEVFIRSAVEAGRVCLEFSSPDLPSSSEEVRQLFEPFGCGFAGGAGLALASARHIVEMNGGRISARSDNGRDLSLRGDFPVAV